MPHGQQSLWQSAAVFPIFQSHPSWAWSHGSANWEASFAGSRGVGKRGGRPPVHTRTPNPGPRDRHWIPRCLPTRGREPTLPCASGALTRGGLLSATWFCRLVIQPGRKLLAPENSSALRPSGPNAEGRRTPSSGRGCGSSAGGVAGHGSTPALPFGLH